MEGLSQIDLKWFEKWRAEDLGEKEERAVRQLAEWFVTTPTGDEALRRIEGTKRQRFLPFNSQ